MTGRYASADLPIPAVTEIGRAFGGSYSISERMFGGYIDHLGGERMRATLPSLFATLDAIRGVDLSATTGYGTWDPTGVAPHWSWMAALLDVATDRPEDKGRGWWRRLEASATGADRFDEALHHMSALAAFCPEERHLIHRGLIHVNVLAAGDRISAVFDWGCALYVDVLYDPASIAFWSARPRQSPTARSSNNRANQEAMLKPRDTQKSSSRPIVVTVVSVSMSSAAAAGRLSDPE